MDVSPLVEIEAQRTEYNGQKGDSWHEEIAKDTHGTKFKESEA